MDAGELVPDDDHDRRRRRAARPATTPRTAATSSTASPAPWARPRRSTSIAADRAARPGHRPRGARRRRARAHRRPPGVRRLRHQLLASTSRPRTTGPATSAAARSCSAPTTPRRPSRKRLDALRAETAPLIDVVRRRAGCWSTVDGLGTADEVTARLIGAIDDRAVAAGWPMLECARRRSVRTPEQLARRCAGPAGWWPRCTSRIRAAIRPGVTTAELDADRPRRARPPRGARSNFLGYHGFPAVICASPNDMIVHGIPGADRAATRATSSRSTAAPSSTAGTATPPSPRRSARSRRRRSALIDVTEAVARRRHRRRWSTGNRLGDIGHAVQQVAESAGFSVVREYTGHAIGTGHARGARRCPNYGRPGTGPKLKVGNVLRRRADGQRRARRDRAARRRLERRHRRRLAGRPTSSTPSPSPTTAPRS